MNSPAEASDRVVAALYRFVRLDDFAALRSPLLEVCQRAQVKGTLLLAKEGINGTIAGSRKSIDAVIAWLEQDARFANLDWKESFHSAAPFHRMKVKLKKEIVTMGVEDIDPSVCVGQYATPAQWNALIDDPDCLVIDTRNDYEVAIGTFRGAINPETENFRDLPSWIDTHLQPTHHKKVAMFCTGGIRCEKSTNFLLGEGVEEVYHLKGGILKYLEEVPQEESTWHGECFVFDNRVSVGHGLIEGSFDQCYACRRPITESDKNRIDYIKGVQCHQCLDEYSDEDRARFGERQRQIDAAAR